MMLIQFRFVLILIHIHILITGTICFAQCPGDTIPTNLGKSLRTISIDTVKAEDIGLSIKASVPGGSWGTAENEAAVISVFVNEEYLQDVILFGGSDVFEYKILLGVLRIGKNNISLKLNTERSAKNTRAVNVSAVSIVRPNTKDDLEKLAIENTPYIYVRPNVVDKFSDIPLITYYEILPAAGGEERIRYTTIFTNEDGGTQSRALMARWGRMTDIEWVYEISVKNGKVLSATIQGENHQVKNFKGKYVFGSHPLIYDSTVNNNFSDTGCSGLRTSNFPIRADLAKKSRETIMDDNPWTYRIMTEEATREGRIDSKNMGVNTIGDLRDYLFVEVVSENNDTAVSVEAVTTGGERFSSDIEDARLRVGRPGYQRIAVHFPHSTDKLSSLSLVCHSATNTSSVGATCGASRIVRFVRLNKVLSLDQTRNKDERTRVIKPKESFVWQVPK